MEMKTSKKASDSQLNINQDINAKSEPKIDTKTAAKSTFLEFCNSTSIHGVQYIGVRRRFDRCFWIFIVIILLCLCVFYVRPIIVKWRKNPIELNFEHTFESISTISFPAITVCPLHLPNKKIYNFSQVLDTAYKTGFDDFTLEQLKLYKLMCQTCYEDSLNDYQKYKSAKMFPLNVTLNDSDKFGNYLLPTPFSLYNCRGVKDKHPWTCDMEFHQHLLDIGLCHSFNMLPKSQIFRPNVNYGLSETPNYVPPNISFFENEIRAGGKQYSVYSNRDMFTLRTLFFEEFQDEKCDPDFFFFIHKPNEIPWEGVSRFRMPLKDKPQEMFFSVEPDVILTDDNLRSFEPAYRDCYFADERPLKYFREYSKANCEYECYVNVTEKQNNCLPDFMPRSSDSKICKISTTQTIIIEPFKLDAEHLSNCDCLNDCNSIDYKIRLSNIHSSREKRLQFTNEPMDENKEDYIRQAHRGAINVKLYLMKVKPDEIPKNITEEEIDGIVRNNIEKFAPHFNTSQWNSTVFHVYFSKSKYLPMRRYTTYTFADFISQCGGIFGGMMGFSFLSIFEILYFCTIRLLEKRKLAHVDVSGENMGFEDTERDQN
uniref:CSON006446 protein n=1 Tax=Culicoides sonorensis TaxID=179676 RepID=A0A336M0A3_CULSO